MSESVKKERPNAGRLGQAGELKMGVGRGFVQRLTQPSLRHPTLPSEDVVLYVLSGLTESTPR